MALISLLSGRSGAGSSTPEPGAGTSTIPLFAAANPNVTPISLLPHRRIKHDLAGDLARFHQPMGYRGLPERHDALDLRLDFALCGGRETLQQVGRIVAGPPDDGDLLVIEVREVDG